MANPIKYTDLFEGTLKGDLEGLVEQVRSLRTELEGMVTEVKKAAKDAGAGLNNTKPSEDNLKAIEKLRLAYQSLNEKIEITDEVLEAVALRQRDVNKAVKNGNDVNKSLEGSYNELKAQFNLLDTALNAMSEDMRKNSEYGKAMEKQARNLRDAMKALRAEVGDNTLNVGNYASATKDITKELNGLQIATFQVAREMPTLANSLQQFFVAISNNVPIYVDNLKKVQQATGSWATAIGASLKMLVSWQTVLLVVLTVLPKLAKAIHDKRKAQEEANKADSKALTLVQRLANSYSEEAKAIARASSEMKTLYGIMQDANRLDEERQSAMEALNRLSGLEVQSYKDKSEAIENYILHLDKEAKAKAIMAEITQAYVDIEESRKEIDDIKRSEKYLKLQEKLNKALHEYNSIFNVYGDPTSGYSATTATAKHLEENVTKAQEALNKMTASQESAITKSNDFIKKKESELTADLLDELGKQTKGRAKATKERVKEAEDYYWEYQDAMAKALYEGVELEARLSDLSYDKQIADYERALKEQKEAGVLTAQQEEYLNGILISLANQKSEARLAIYEKFYDLLLKEQADYITQMIAEEKSEVKQTYDVLLADNANKIIAQRNKINETIKNGTYKEVKEEAKILQEQLKEKLRLEKEYQIEVLKIRLANFEITQAEFDNQLSAINEAYNNALRQIGKSRRGRFSFWNLIFGEADVNDKAGVSKILSSEMQTFTKQLEGMFKSTMQYLDQIIAKRIELADTMVQSAQREAESAKSALEIEQQARANGYANNVELARKEYEKNLELERKALAEKKRLQAVQEAIDTAQQVSSLITATANLWSSLTAGNPLGAILAGIATAGMFASFTAAKAMAWSVASKKETYGDGMSEYLDYGGSHASGHDIDFGVTKDGRRRTVERGEMIGVINKRNVNKYGVSRIQDIISSLNNGTFENSYFSDKDMQDKYGLALAGLQITQATDLSRIESGLDTLVKQGSVRVVNTSEGRIEYRGNNKRIIRKS